MGLIEPDALALGVPEMDVTHGELIRLLSGVRAALRQGDPADAAGRFERVLAHTEQHFAQEEDWMRATACPTTAQHLKEHAAVLRLMQTVASAMRQARQPKLVVLAIEELHRWLPDHARGLDGDLARHMESVGYVIEPGERSRRMRAALTGIDAAAPR